MASANGDCAVLAAGINDFVVRTGRGLSASSFGDRFRHEVQERCRKGCRGKPATIQQLARLLIMEPNHRGVSQVLRRLTELKERDPVFSDIEIDHYKEYWEAVRLGDFETPEAGFAEISHRRTYLRPQPPARALSIIHKAKGLECDSVILMPCDAKTFPDKPDARCLLYVALSRGMKRLLLVVSKQRPSPLFTL
jgi:hypothetical protein